MKKIDLHSHTTASDGIYSPGALVEHAINNDISVLVIADHDTVDGIEEALQNARGKGITIVPAIEYSIEFSPGTFHLLGLFIDHTDAELINTVRYLSEQRNHRAARIVDDLVKNGIEITIEEVTANAQGGAIGKPHVARVLVKHGYAENVRDVFKKFLEPGLPGYVPKTRISLDDALRLTRNAGGIAVLAHPASLGLRQGAEMENFLQEIVAKGVSGIEVYSEMHNERDIAYYLKLAREYDLAVTGGSDFHGDKGEVMGYYGKGKAVPVRLYEELLAYVQQHSFKEIDGRGSD